MTDRARPSVQLQRLRHGDGPAVVPATTRSGRQAASSVSLGGGSPGGGDQPAPPAGRNPARRALGAAIAAVVLIGGGVAAAAITGSGDGSTRVVADGGPPDQLGRGGDGFPTLPDGSPDPRARRSGTTSSSTRTQTGSSSTSSGSSSTAGTTVHPPTSAPRRAWPTTQPPTSAPPRPASIALTTRSMSFTTTTVTRTLGVRNAGGSTLSWRVSTSSPFSASPSSGTLAPGRSATVTVRLATGQAAEGVTRGQLKVSGASGSGTVSLRAVVERPPVIIRPAAAPDPLYVKGCGKDRPSNLVVAAGVSGVDPNDRNAVVVRWTDTSRVERNPVEMVLLKEQGYWITFLPPNTAPGTLWWSIRATDERGNATTTPPAPVTVKSC